MHYNFIKRGIEMKYIACVIVGIKLAIGVFSQAFQY
jgi:hypothetical protein